MSKRPQPRRDEVILSPHVARWLRMAADTRSKDEAMQGDAAKQVMLEIAAGSDRLVRHGVTLALAEIALNVQPPSA